MDTPKYSRDTENSPLGLRERRRRETMAEIHAAAVARFEQQGVVGTTVDEIAADAGVSARTFFRYFPTKEHAAFPADHDFHELAEDTLREIRGGASLFDALQDAWSRLFAESDRRPENVEEAMRLRRLAEREPTLIALLAVEDGRLDAEIAAEAALALGRAADDLAVQAAVIAVNGAARLAFREWGRLYESGDAVPISEVYARLLAELADFLGVPGRRAPGEGEPPVPGEGVSPVPGGGESPMPR